MAKHSAIEWTDSTWNPWVGCRRVSQGCRHCYAERDMTRFGKAFTTVTRTADTTFRSPLKWKDPAFAFTCSWGDFLSGPGFRESKVTGFRNLRDQCKVEGVPYFFKQHGGTSKINGAWGGNLLDGKVHQGRPEVVDVARRTNPTLFD